MPPALNVSPDLQLPGAVVTSTVAIVAMTGAGKSNAGVVLAEELHAISAPWVAIDPKGDWWGIRSSGDGKGPGLPIPIFGGLHGDLPLREEMGRLIADLIFDQNLTCILDVSEFPSKAAQMRFLTEFGDQLYRRHGTKPSPRHMILEEADEYLPQQVHADEAKCVGVWTRIVKRGRQRGLGVTIITQRSAEVNKGALSQCATLIPLRTTGAHDRKAIRDWIDYHDTSREIVDQLPRLGDGEAFAISPHWLVLHNQPAVQRFQWRRRWTFDSGATPELGDSRPAATLADIDLGLLEARLAVVIEEAAQDDPKILRRRLAEKDDYIAELQRQIAARPDADPAELADLRARVADLQARPPEVVQMPVLTDADRARLDAAFRDLMEISRIIATAAGHVDVVPSTKASPPAEAIDPVQRGPARPAPPLRQATRPPPLVLQEAPGLQDPRAPLTARALTKAERTLLGVLAQFPAGRGRIQLALLSHYSSKSSHFGNVLGALRSAGLVSRGEPIRATPEGLAAIAGAYEQLPTGDALVDHWMHELKAAERKLLLCLLDAYPEPMTRDQLAEASGYSAGSSHFGNSLGRLRSLQLVSRGADIRVDDDFAREVGRG